MQRDLEGVGPHGVDRADEAAPDDVLDLDDGAIAGQRPQRVADPELSEDPLTILTRPAEPLDLDDRIGRDERRAARTVLHDDPPRPGVEQVPDDEPAAEKHEMDRPVMASQPLTERDPRTLGPDALDDIGVTLRDRLLQELTLEVFEQPIPAHVTTFPCVLRLVCRKPRDPAASRGVARTSVPANSGT